MTDKQPLPDIAAPFNNAIDTLRGLRDTLNKVNESIFRYGDASKQTVGLKLVIMRTYYITASPLISDDARARLKAIRDPLMIEIEKWERSPNETSIKRAKYYSHKLDDLLEAIMNELQKEKYFMPPKKDPRRAIIE